MSPLLTTHMFLVVVVVSPFPLPSVNGTQDSSKNLYVLMSARKELLLEYRYPLHQHSIMWCSGMVGLMRELILSVFS